MNSTKWKFGCLFVVAVTWLAACGSPDIRAPHNVYSPQVASEKIPLSVALYITDDLTASEWEITSLGWSMKVGESLAENSERLARDIFSDVIVIRGAFQPFDLDNRVMLVPKIVYMNRTTGATSFGESITAIKIEWNLMTMENEPIWVNTIGGQASGTTGWANRESLLEEALRNLFAQSYESFVLSAAIRRYTSRNITR